MKDKNPILADLDTFILSMIGDENQRDSNAVLKINKNNYNRIYPFRLYLLEKSVFVVQIWIT